MHTYIIRILKLDTYSNNFWFSNISVILEVVANVQNLVYMEKECYFIIPKNVQMQIHLYHCAFWRLSLFSRIEVAAAKLSLPGWFTRKWTRTIKPRPLVLARCWIYLNDLVNNYIKSTWCSLAFDVLFCLILIFIYPGAEEQFIPRVRVAELGGRGGICPAIFWGFI